MLYTMGYIKDALAVPAFTALLTLVVLALYGHQDSLSVAHNIPKITAAFCVVAILIDGIFMLYPDFHCHAVFFPERAEVKQ